MLKECNDAPMVGIFMPAYNQGSFVDEAIDSLKKQTFQDFVVHIVDDGSNDGVTPEKLASIKYNKAELFLNNDNKGVVFRAKQHYKLFKTKYVLVLCADDILAPTFLEKTVKFLEENKEYGAVSVNLKVFKKSIDDGGAETKFDAMKMKLKYLLARNRVLGSSLMRREALLDTDLSGGFKRYQDWDRWISMLEAGWKIGLVPETLFYYRQVPSSLSHLASIEDELEIRRKLLTKHKKSYRLYYENVILDMEQAFLEVLGGKNWLEGQYEFLNKENDRLKKEVKNLKKYGRVVYYVRKGMRKNRGEGRCLEK